MPLPKSAPENDKNERPRVITPEEAFLAAFETVLVDEPVPFNFDGSISRKHMRSVWSWLIRDVYPELETGLSEAIAAGSSTEAAIDAMLPALLTRARETVSASTTSSELERRLTAQLGGEDLRNRMPVILAMLRCRPLFAKAMAFGRASNDLTDDAALGVALKSMPLKDPSVAALLLHGVVGQSANPSQIASALIHIAGGASERVVAGAGLSPLVDAILAHAQNQLSKLSTQSGIPVSTAKVCTAVDRFHKLIRAVTGYIELVQGSRWSKIAAEVTKLMAEQIEPRIREVSADVTQSLRKKREGTDRIDSERLRTALDGIRLLVAVRDARESLALNALFEQLWSETGQNLEILLQRNLELFKQNPGDAITAERLDMGIKMAEIRFNAEYAEILSRARDSVERRAEAPVKTASQ